MVSTSPTAKLTGELMVKVPVVPEAATAMVPKLVPFFRSVNVQEPVAAVINVKYWFVVPDAMVYAMLALL